jgi:hypothetical protein
MRSSVAWFCFPCLLRRIFPYFTGIHRRVFIWFYLVFALLSLVILLPGAISGHGEPLSTSIWGIILAFAGPFTGMVSRGFILHTVVPVSFLTALPVLVQACCFSLSRFRAAA